MSKQKHTFRFIIFLLYFICGIVMLAVSFSLGSFMLMVAALYITVIGFFCVLYHLIPPSLIKDIEKNIKDKDQ